MLVWERIFDMSPFFFSKLVGHVFISHRLPPPQASLYKDVFLNVRPREEEEEEEYWCLYYQREPSLPILIMVDHKSKTNLKERIIFHP